MRHVLATVFVFLVAAGTLSAAVFEPVTDSQLVQRAELIVVADVVRSQSRMLPNGAIVTDTTLSVRDVLKGTAGAEVVVTDMGGFIGDRGMVIPGSAQYRMQSRVVALLEPRPDGGWFTSTMALGLFRFEKRADGLEVFTRDAEGAEAEGAEIATDRMAGSFEQFVRGVAASHVSVQSMNAPMAPELDERFVPETNALAADYALKAGSPSLSVRWNFSPGGTVNYKINPNASGGWPIGSADPGLASSRGMDMWTDHADSFINMNHAGPSAADSVGSSDSENTIVFGSIPPNVGGCTSSAIACGVFWVAGTHTFDGSSFRTITEGDVVLRPQTVGQNVLDALVAHELGHSIGLRHSNESGRSPTTSTALMNSSVPTSAGAAMKQWDMDAMAEMYGNGIPCVPVTTVSISGGGNVTAGNKKTLTANHNGNGVFTYQWYRGAAGNTSEPVGTGKTFETPPVNEQMSFWVRVANDCPSTKDSSAVTVQPTQPPGCNPVLITQQPTNPTITPGQTTTLSVEATGTAPLSYQWFQGLVGDTSVPVGNSATFTTPPLTTTTNYWVRVSNTCNQGSSKNSNQSTVTVQQQCAAVTIASFTGSVSVETGGSANLGVGVNGTAPFTYQWYFGEFGDASQPIAGATSETLTVGPFASPGVRKYWVQVRNCQQAIANAGAAVITVTCPTPRQPIIQLPPLVNANLPAFKVRWEAPSGVSGYRFELQRADNPSFNGVFSETVDGTEHIVSTAGLVPDKRYYMRVRAVSLCNQAVSEFAIAGSFFFQGASKPDIGKDGGVLPPLNGPFDSNDPVSQDFRLISDGTSARTGIAATETFTITSDQPWVSVSPTSGIVPPQGIDVKITVDPSELPIGSSSATLVITRDDGASAAKPGVFSTSTVKLPLSFGKVTPVSPVPRDAAVSASTLIIPAIAHADGLGARFQSDVRIANTSTETLTYDLSFTPTVTNGLQGGKKTTVDIAAGKTFALDDIVQIWFGSGVGGELGSGTLQIVPLRTASGVPVTPLMTAASSRLFAIGPAGTLGQFIPAMAASRFIGDTAADPLSKISLQQIAQSAAFRTNLGFVEGTGAPATMLVKAINASGATVAQKELSLSPFEHQQHSFSTFFPNLLLTDGRIEVTATSTSGKVTAYASVLDNRTTDPLMVFPEQAGRMSATRYVVPGIAELTAATNFHSDMRIFNASANPVTITLNYFPQSGDATPRPAAVTRPIAANQTLAIDNVLPSLWNINASGGSVVITSPNDSSLVATARTFSRDANGGTYGQFIPGATAAEAVGTGERSLQVLQLEDSDNFRSNLGLYEVTGMPVTVEVQAHTGEGKITPVIHVDLQAHGFIQFGRILTSMGLAPDERYNGRVSVKAIGGVGRVASYGSVIDNRTADPTYVPAQ